MATGTAPAKALKIVLDPVSREPVYLQVFQSVCHSIESGIVAAGSRLASPQQLAEELGLPKGTIRRAFNKLVTGGYVGGSAAAGFFVLDGTERKKKPLEEPVPPAAPVSKVPAPTPARPVTAAKPKLAAPPLPPVVVPTPPPPVPEPVRAPAFNRLPAVEQIDASRLQTPGPPRPFRPGFPDTREFPLELWESLRARLLRERTAELLDFCGTFGYLPLREAIATRLRNARGVKCAPEQVIITAGSQHAVNLIINTLVSPGDVIGMEEPGCYGARAAFQQAGGRVVPLLVDEEGLIVPDAHRKNPPVLLYATPANQFPLGVALTLPRRLALLDFARQTNAWIVEDDSDGDFSYTGRPLPSLQGADQQHRVIYLGTTGRTLFSSLEIGYLVVPTSQIGSFSKVKEVIGGQPSVIDQATLAQFVSEGHFDRHIRRMNVIYHQRLQALTESVGSELAGYIDLEPAQGGLHAVGWLSRGVEEERVANSASNAGIELPMLSQYGRTALVRPGVVFGFAASSEKMIRQTVRTLGQALRSPDSQKALPPASGNWREHASQTTPQPAPGFFQRLFGRSNSR